MNAAPLAPYRVSAFNTAHDSENKIHDDATARRFGFGGGLVPGVDVYGYMTHMPVARWGRAWLSPPLVDAVSQTMASGEQAMLFLNRRGYAPVTICRTCGHRLHCPSCTA